MSQDLARPIRYHIKRALQILKSHAQPDRPLVIHVFNGGKKILIAFWLQNSAFLTYVTRAAVAQAFREARRLKHVCNQQFTVTEKKCLGIDAQREMKSQALHVSFEATN